MTKNKNDKLKNLSLSFLCVDVVIRCKKCDLHIYSYEKVLTEPPDISEAAIPTYNYAYTHKFKYLRYNVISHTFSSLRNNYNLTFAFFAASKSDNVIVKKSSYDISDNIGAMRFALAFITFSKKFRTSLPFA